MQFLTFILSIKLNSSTGLSSLLLQRNMNTKFHRYHPSNIMLEKYILYRVLKCPGKPGKTENQIVSFEKSLKTATKNSAENLREKLK